MPETYRASCIYGLQGLRSRDLCTVGTSVLHAMEHFWKEWAHFFLGPLPASFTSLSPVVMTREGVTVHEKAKTLLSQYNVTRASCTHVYELVTQLQLSVAVT